MSHASDTDPDPDIDDMNVLAAIGHHTVLLGVKLFNIELLGVNARTGKKLVLSLALIAIVYSVRWLVLWVIRQIVTDRPDAAGFWSRQGVQLLAAIVAIIGLFSIWINPGTDLTTGLGLISAGLAFALQQVITAIAGYFVILRGDTFNVGDRIVLGKVRGDVIKLGFIKTTVLEMGQPPSVQDSDPAVWIHARQYTGRLVTVSNGRIFDEPVFNYTRDFPFVWDEIVIPITYKADRVKVEQILLASVDHAVPPTEMTSEALAEMQDRYSVRSVDLEPHVYLRITDNWLELALRFVLPTGSVRGTKDAMSRYIIDELDAAGIEVASATYEIVGLPSIEINQSP